MRSLYTAAVCLALAHTSIARVPHSFRDLIEREPEPEPESETEHGIVHWISRLFKRFAQTSSTGGTCYEDVYYLFVEDLQQPSFCQQFLNIPNRTTTVDNTPTTTTTDLFTTYVATAEELSRVTPQSTLTVTTTTQPSLGRRGAEGMAQVQIDDAIQMFRRQNAAASSSPNDASLSQSFSSACSCLDYPGSIVTATYTNEPITTTLSEFRRTTTTTTRTTTAAPQVTTTTLTAEATDTGGPPPGSPTSATSAPSGGSQTSTSSSGEPTPTSPPFTCPDDNNIVISQLVGNERFDYLILCDVVLMDGDFYGNALSYSSFGQCASACSIANANFTEAVCQGVSYFATGSSSGNCFLKGSANLTTEANGVDSAVLQRIAIGITNNSTAGTTTENAPFSGQTMTQDPQQMSSMMQSILSNSSEAMPIVTPPPMVVQSGMLVNAPGGVYSTYVSAGSTFSTGTAYSFSTMYSDGSWYMTYFTSYSVAWATATTVYQASETGYSVDSSSDTDHTITSGSDGGYVETTTTNQTTPFPGGYNVTEEISQEFFNANGTLTSSTATTYFYTYETGGAASGNAGGIPGSTAGGISGGGNGGASGGPGSGGPVTSTSIFSTESVIIISGGTAFASSTEASGGATPTPIVSATTIVNSFGSAFSTGFAASGGGSGLGSAASGAASGAPSSATPTPISIIINSGGTGGFSSFAASGGPTGIGGQSNTQASGGPTGVGGINITVASGGPTGTGGVSSTQASGGPSPSQTGTFTNSGPPRQGGPQSSTPGSASIPVFPTSTGGVYTLPPSSTPSGTAPSGPLSNGPSPFPSNSTMSPGTGTAPTSPSGPLSTGPSPHSSVNSTAPSGTGTAPSSSPSGHFSNSAPPRSGTFSTTHPTHYGSFTNTAPPRSGTFSTRHPGTSPSGSAPSGTAPPGTAPPSSSSRRHGHGHTVAPVNTSFPSTSRFPNSTMLNTGTGTSPPLSTLPTTMISPSTCANMTLGTTTIFSTTTIYGCASTCNPWGGYGSGPQHFGPPAWPTG